MIDGAIDERLCSGRENGMTKEHEQGEKESDDWSESLHFSSETHTHAIVNRGGGGGDGGKEPATRRETRDCRTWHTLSLLHVSMQHDKHDQLRHVWRWLVSATLLLLLLAGMCNPYITCVTAVSLLVIPYGR